MDSQFLGSAVEMMILEVAAEGPTYGYALAQTVSERSNGYFELKEGSLYPALHRLERSKFLKSLWRESDGRRRKYYELTEAGRAELASRKQSWLRFAAAINGVLRSNQAGWAETM
jgi:PadR family transcriptional regulator, regulatory protein PadR